MRSCGFRLRCLQIAALLPFIGGAFFLESGTAHAQASIPQSGLIANIPFTEQAGTVANDSSGNGNACTFSASPNSPTWNGIGIGFAGLDVYDHESCTFPAAFSASARTVAVCAYIPAAVEMSNLNGSSQGTGGGLSFPTLLGATNRNGLTLWLATPPYGSARLYYQQSMYSGYGSFPSGTNDMSIGWNCFFYEMGSASDAPATVDHLFKNGVETTSYSAQGASAALAAASGVWYLGGGGFSTGLQFVGTVEHVLAWNRLLSPTEVEQTWQTLQTEMTGRGVVFDPQGSQTTNAVADCLGDSQTSGTLAGVSWCSMGLLTLPPVATWELNNNGEGGTTCVSMESGVPAEEALDWSPKAPHSVMMLYCGINDFTVGGLTPAEIWQRQLATCQLAKQAGYEYVTDATLPSWLVQDANVQGLDTLVRANWQSCFSSVVDVANDPRLGATGAYANSTYFLVQDPSHLNATGQGILGGYTSNILASLYGSTAAAPTVVSASFTEAAADNFVRVQSAAQAVTVTLPSCLGYVAGHARSVTNAGSGAVTVEAQGEQFINGSSSAVAVSSGKTDVFFVQPLSLATSGCAWTTATTRYPAIVLTVPYPIEVGQSVTLTAAASGGGGTPTGTVSFAVGSTVLATEPLSNGVASYTASTNGILPGTYVLTAEYSGDSVYTPSTSAAASVELEQVQTATTLTASPNPVAPPAAVTLTATVKRHYGTTTGVPGGRVTFYYGTEALGSAGLNSSGVATYVASTKGVSAGTYAITAQYDGDVYDLASSSAAVSVTVE
jgi:hypothetical protein